MSTVPTRTCAGGSFTLPCVGVGCWSFGSKEGEYWGERDQAATNAIVAAAVKAGAWFDTAEAYQNGRSEEALGVALQAAGSEGIVASKILPQNCGDVRKHLTTSLEYLKAKSMLLYQVHWPLNAATCGDNIPSVTETFKQLAELQKEGLIQHIGVSNFGVKQLKEALATGVKIVTNQLMYNLLSRAIEYEVIPLCAENDIGVICYSPLLQGLLTDKGDIDTADEYRTRTRHFAGTRPKSRHGEEGAEPEMKAALAAVKEIAKREGRSVAELSMSWCLANPSVISIIPGARNTEQLESNLKVATATVSAELKAELDAATEPVRAKLGTFIDYYAGKDNQRCE